MRAARAGRADDRDVVTDIRAQLRELQSLERHFVRVLREGGETVRIAGGYERGPLAEQTYGSRIVHPITEGDAVVVKTDVDEEMPLGRPCLAECVGCALVV